jgi:alkanesulfonate monooxygenase SsuD/methylene tetrahydromethanopterin reductase-like flavin-dependent oxidoreductase (luciferase family)
MLSVLAQLALTLDHYSEGRFFLALGAGENKQCPPYSADSSRRIA